MAERARYTTTWSFYLTWHLVAVFRNCSTNTDQTIPIRELMKSGFPQKLFRELKFNLDQIIYDPWTTEFYYVTSCNLKKLEISIYPLCSSLALYYLGLAYPLPFLSLKKSMICLNLALNLFKSSLVATFFSNNCVILWAQFFVVCFAAVPLLDKPFLIQYFEMRT